MDRPAVDVVVPFRGSEAGLAEVRARMSSLDLGPDDTLTVVDNSPSPHPVTGVVSAPALQTPGYARNRGAERGSAPWLVFLDADVEPRPDVCTALFDPPPRDSTALLAGGVRDQPAAAGDGPAARWASLRGAMGQDMSLQHGEWAFVQTSNCAVRRAAFEEVGGFCEPIRAGEDADLTYRLRAAGWQTERREGAVVTHRNRTTLRALLGQKACHGAAGAWLEERYPGSSPSRRLPGLVWWGVRHAVAGTARAAWTRRGDDAVLAVMDPVTTIAFELGRRLPNRRPLRGR